MSVTVSDAVIPALALGKGDYVQCKKCAATIKDNKWAHIKAHDDGWFFSKDRTAYCPKHIPGWVKGWRARRDAK